MRLNPLQFKFSQYIAQLIQYIKSQGYDVTFGDATRSDCRGHAFLSFHYIGLAIDLNIFKNGKYLTSTIDHRQFGDYWKRLDSLCTWGGDFSDGNHYSFGENSQLEIYDELIKKIKQKQSRRLL